MSGARAVRDLLAEAMRRERHGLVRPLWDAAPEEFREHWRMRADFILGVLAEEGCCLAPLCVRPADGARAIEAFIKRDEEPAS